MSTEPHKAYDAWKEFEEKLKAESKEKKVKRFAEIRAIPNEEEKQQALYEMIGNIPDKVDRYQELLTRAIDLTEQFHTLAEEMAQQTEDFPRLRVDAIRLLTRRFDKLLRDRLPQLFGFEQQEMDKIIRAMEMDRRERAKRETLEGMPYEDYLKTPHWYQTREDALRTARRRCQLCNSTRYLEVHHRTYERRGHELPEDLIVLCKNCHAKHHDKLDKDQPFHWLFNIDNEDTK